MSERDYLEMYRNFLDFFFLMMDPEDQLPIHIASYTVSEAELPGEVLYLSGQYLTERCPHSLKVALQRIVFEELRVDIARSPEAFGYDEGESAYVMLRLMQAVTAKVNRVGMRYMDNSELVKLLPPAGHTEPNIGIWSVKNTRRVMEDRHMVINSLEAYFGIESPTSTSFYAVYDGHVGSAAATYCAAHLHQYLVESPVFSTNLAKAMRDAFLRTDADFLVKAALGGSTAVVVTVRGHHLLAAWAGDSQALLAKRMRLMQLVRPHKPCRPDERMRIEKAGGVVQLYGLWRVNGQLAVSRAIGDYLFKPSVIALPELMSVDLDGEEDFVVLACDGLWDHVSEDDVALAVYRQLKFEPNDLNASARNLVLQAKRQGSTDNITIIVVLLKDPRDIVDTLPMDFGLESSLANAPPAPHAMEAEACKQPESSTNGQSHRVDVISLLSDSDSNSDNDSDGFGPETAVDAELDDEEDGEAIVDGDADVGDNAAVDGEAAVAENSDANSDVVIIRPNVDTGNVSSCNQLDANTNGKNRRDPTDLYSSITDSDSENDSDEHSPEAAVNVDGEADGNNVVQISAPLTLHTEEVTLALGGRSPLDNVADSCDDSEEEWNYIKGEQSEPRTTEEPDKKNISSSTPSFLSPGSVKSSEYSTPLNLLQPGVAASSVEMNQEASPLDMLSPLNPEAPVFVPGTPGDILLAESTRKPMPIDDVDVAQFCADAEARPAELVDLENGNHVNGHHNVSIDERQRLNGNEKSLEFAFNVGVDEKSTDSGLIQDLQRIQKDTTDFCNLQVYQHNEFNPFETEGNEELVERLKNKERDPMNRSFYQEKDNDTSVKQDIPVDMNAVCLLPDSDSDSGDDADSRNNIDDINNMTHNDLVGLESTPMPKKFSDFTDTNETMNSFNDSTQHNLSEVFSTPESQKLLFEVIPEKPDQKSPELGFANNSALEEFLHDVPMLSNSSNERRQDLVLERDQIDLDFGHKEDQNEPGVEPEAAATPEQEHFQSHAMFTESLLPAASTLPSQPLEASPVSSPLPLQTEVSPALSPVTCPQPLEPSPAPSPLPTTPTPLPLIMRTEATPESPLIAVEPVVSSLDIISNFSEPVPVTDLDQVESRTPDLLVPANTELPSASQPTLAEPFAAPQDAFIQSEDIAAVVSLPQATPDAATSPEATPDDAPLVQLTSDVALATVAATTAAATTAAVAAATKKTQPMQASIAHKGPKTSSLKSLPKTSTTLKSNLTAKTPPAKAPAAKSTSVAAKPAPITKPPAGKPALPAAKAATKSAPAVKLAAKPGPAAPVAKVGAKPAPAVPAAKAGLITKSAPRPTSARAAPAPKPAASAPKLAAPAPKLAAKEVPLAKRPIAKALPLRPVATAPTTKPTSTVSARPAAPRSATPRVAQPRPASTATSLARNKPADKKPPTLPNGDVKISPRPAPPRSTLRAAPPTGNPAPKNPSTRPMPRARPPTDATKQSKDLANKNITGKTTSTASTANKAPSKPAPIRAPKKVIVEVKDTNVADTEPQPALANGLPDKQPPMDPVDLPDKQPPVDTIDLTDEQPPMSPGQFPNVFA